MNVRWFSADSAGMLYWNVMSLSRKANLSIYIPSLSFGHNLWTEGMMSLNASSQKEAPLWGVWAQQQSEELVAQSWWFSWGGSGISLGRLLDADLLGTSSWKEKIMDCFMSHYFHLYLIHTEEAESSWSPTPSCIPHVTSFRNNGS